MNAVAPKPLTSGEIRRRVEAYLLAVDPLVKMAIKIELSQPIGYRVGNDGTLDRICQYGWSTEAVALYVAIQKEIEYLKDLYLTEGGLYAGSGREGLRREADRIWSGSFRN